MAVLEISGLYKKYSRKDAYAVNDICLKVEQGELLALLGESGSGKTTLLRLIAGFEAPEKGSIVINGKTIVSDGYFMAPEKRSIGMVFQEYALFPHMTILDNVVFGLHKITKTEAQARAKQVLKMVGLLGYAQRFPHQLSGGQQQRAALARALALNPAILLLDEPFSNLDGVLKEQVREDLKNILKETNTTAIFVTHDTKDALATADRIALMKEGRIQQIGKPKYLYERPANIYAAGFLGKVNILQATTTEDGYDSQIGKIKYPVHQKPGQKVTLAVRPEHISITSKKPDLLTGPVESTSYHGENQMVTLRINAGKGSTRFMIKSTCDCQWNKGDEISFAIDAEKIHVLDTCWFPGTLKTESQ